MTGIFVPFPNICFSMSCLSNFMVLFSLLSSADLIGLIFHFLEVIYLIFPSSVCLKFVTHTGILIFFFFFYPEN